MLDDEQPIIEVTSDIRLFERYWGWEIRVRGHLIGSIVQGPRPIPHLGLYVVTHRNRDGSVRVDRMISFEQAVEYVEVNAGYIQ
jgi:hypothetical protein